MSDSIHVTSKLNIKIDSRRTSPGGPNVHGAYMHCA